MNLSFDELMALADTYDDIAEDEFMSFTCPNCGFQEEVPTWVIDEQFDMAIFSGHDRKSFIPTSNCIKCPTDMIPTDKLNK